MDEKKAALITGAARRIGRSIALSLGERGFGIIVHYHSSRREAQDLCEELALKGVKAWPIKADLEDPDGYEALIDASLRHFPGLCLLINNSSIFPSGDLNEVTLGDFNRNMLINAWAPLCLSRAFARRVKEGSIVNILDSRAPGHDPSHVAYGLSKHALMAVTAICAARFAPAIRVNGVAPGLILPPAGKDVAYLENLKNRVPLKKYGDPQDIARAVVFLAESDFISGQIIYVDGGRHSLAAYP